MRILSLEISNVEKTVYSKMHFNKNSNIIRYDDDAILKAVSLISGNETKFSFVNSKSYIMSKVEIEKTYEVNIRFKYGKPDLKVYDDKKQLCTDEYFSLVRKSKEESAVTYFEDFRKEKYPLRLAFYKDNKYFYKGRFSRLTNGIGATRSFRAFTNEFIKNFKSELINEENALWLSLKESGEFVVTKGKNGKVITDLSEKDFFLYNALCFISLVKFWDEFNEIRNINTIKTPVVIKLPDNCDFDLAAFIYRIKRMNRQILVFDIV